MRIKFECCHVDTCLPDYWGGHHLPHVSIPVYPGMSMKAIKDAIKSELLHGAVCGNTKEAKMLYRSYVGPDNASYADACTKAAYAAVNRMKPAKKGQRKFFTDIEESSEDDDCSVYAYFVFVMED